MEHGDSTVTRKVEYRHVERLFTVLGEIYGPKFTNQFTRENFGQMKYVWLNILREENLLLLKSAVDVLKAKSDDRYKKYPPSPMEIVDLCRQLKNIQIKKPCIGTIHENNCESEVYKQCIARIKKILPSFKGDDSKWDNNEQKRI